MTPEVHSERHAELHRCFDELLADFLACTGKLPSKTMILDLMKWSHEQIENPTPPPPNIAQLILKDADATDVAPMLQAFPLDWDLRLYVCCRGETLNGPPGLRRWTLDAIWKLPTKEELQADPDNLLYNLSCLDNRITISCVESPMAAIAEAIRRVNAEEYDTESVFHPEG